MFAKVRFSKMTEARSVRTKRPVRELISPRRRSARAYAVVTYFDRASFRGVRNRETGAVEAPAVKTVGICPGVLFLLGPFSHPETPDLDKNQPFEDTQRHQQHDHPLLVSHILFSSNSAARQRGDLAIPFPRRRCPSLLQWWHPIMDRLRNAPLCFRSCSKCVTNRKLRSKCRRISPTKSWVDKQRSLFRIQRRECSRSLRIVGISRASSVCQPVFAIAIAVSACRWAGPLQLFHSLASVCVRKEVSAICDPCHQADEQN